MRYFLAFYGDLKKLDMKLKQDRSDLSQFTSNYNSSLCYLYLNSYSQARPHHHKIPWNARTIQQFTWFKFIMSHNLGPKYGTMPTECGPKYGTMTTECGPSFTLCTNPLKIYKTIYDIYARRNLQENVELVNYRNLWNVQWVPCSGGWPRKTAPKQHKTQAKVGPELWAIVQQYTR